MGEKAYTVEIRRLETSDDRASFSCGEPALDRFFAAYAGQNQFRHHIGTTYVAVTDGRVIGYVTVSASQIHCEDLRASRKRRLPRYPLPVLRLARLAVDASMHGRGVGLQLLRAAFTIAREMEQLAGCVGVVVDAQPGAVEFYRRFGFEEIGDVVEGECDVRPRPVLMFLSRDKIPSA